MRLPSAADKSAFSLVPEGVFAGKPAVSPVPEGVFADETRALLERLKQEGAVIVGTDEAGRGPLAGPVVGAAVWLTPEQERELQALGLRDSKLMTPRARERLFEAMREMGVVWRAQAGSVERIERDNILQAALWTMGRSVARLVPLLPGEPACVVVDGLSRIETEYPQCPLVRADRLLPVVSAASVVAKVVRDRIMVILDRRYPGYGLARHKGYATAAHREAVKRLGLSPIHRRSFCRHILEEMATLTFPWDEPAEERDFPKTRASGHKGSEKISKAVSKKGSTRRG